MARTTMILAIAHRPALLAAADRVLHLEDGAVAERVDPAPQQPHPSRSAPL